MAFALGCKDVCLEYAAKKVLDCVTLGVDEGARIGIVGRNGDGKTSLISILAGVLEPESGKVFKRNDLSIRLLEQQDDLDDFATVSESIFEDIPEYVWASDPKIRQIISHLVGSIDLDSQISTLSGGERRRVYLAAVLVQNDDILILDEPTNHLDMLTIAWLAEHLVSRWRASDGVLLMVTHDRWFLDEVCNSMWEVHDAKVEPFEGGYSAYVLQRLEREEAARLAETKRQNLLRRELAWLSRGARARSSKPKFHVEAAEALIANEPPVRNPIELKRAAIARMGKQAVELVGVSKTYNDKTVVDDLSWVISPGDRIGILGENGAGKTTLLKLLNGKTKPDSGYVKVGKTVKMASLSQLLEELEDFGNYQLREVLSRYKTRYEIDGKEVSSSQLLERLGFAPAHLMMPISTLSGGQKRRLQLMLTLLEGANFLILDEPGNDMDIDMLAQIEGVLDSWPGTLIMVTHDRHLMERVTDNQYMIVDGKLLHLPGGVDQYIKMTASEQDGDEQVRDGSLRSGQAGGGEASVSAHGGSGTGVNAAVSGGAVSGVALGGGAAGGTVAGVSASGGAASGASASGAAAGSRTLSNSQRQEARRKLASAERKITTQQAKIDAAKEKLNNCDPADYLALIECENEIAELKARLEELENEWLEASELLGE